MNAGSTDHAIGLAHFSAGRITDALTSFSKALREADSSEFWNDWAAAQFALGSKEEAEAGFRLALALDAKFVQAAVNLGALLFDQRNYAEALPFLEIASSDSNLQQSAIASSLLAKSRSAVTDQLPSSLIEAELRRFQSSNQNELSYFQTHLQRYIRTLQLLPQASAGEKLLELGAAFHHLTPAIAKLKGYSEVCCNDIWQGSPQTIRELQSADGQESFRVAVDNFDVQHSPWPYADATFDAVLFCEMLEHLHTDPMGVLAEIDRVLRPGGSLLLTTPNVASCHSVEYALRGESPYVYGKFEANGASTDRHNREYTPHEVERLALAAGISTVRLETRDSWWQPNREILRLLAARGEPIARRGDNIFFLGRKTGPVLDRYPEEFYLRLGTQTHRRVAQESTSSSTAVTQELPPAPQRLLVIHELVPHSDQSGSDLRLLDVLKELRAQGHQVTFIARDWKNSEKYSPQLQKLGITAIAGDPDRMKHFGLDEPTSWSLRELLHNQHFDAAILCQWFWSGISIPEYYLGEIRHWSPETRIAILTDDRHGERERRSAKLSGLFSDFERARDFEARELAAYHAADMVLYITEADRAHFATLLASTPMGHLPIVAAGDSAPSPEFSARQGVLFLGNFENLANRDALDWLLQEIWPLVHCKLPQLTLYVAGNACPENLARKTQRIISLGKVPNLAATFRDKLALIAPIRFGTGINTKNLQALAHGLPVITTSIGAEGLQLSHQDTALLGDTPLALATSICRLCTDPQLWKTLAANGKALALANFSPQHLARRLREILPRLAKLPAKPAGTSDLESYLLVEKTHPSVLSVHPAGYRTVLRTLAYWQLGSGHLASHDPRGALQQFRHIFTAVRGALSDTAFYRCLLSEMAEAYQSCNEPQAAARCKNELTLLVAPGKNHSPARRRRSYQPPSHKSSTPRLSVVLPTFNRRETLSLCFAALAFQSLSTAEWEVIVVDDGSTDDTADFLRSSQFPFRCTVLSQTNQGAGAARNAGVAAARGEFVLLCNDDTIACSTLLEEHLRLQQFHANTKLAILGQFFPSADCAKRALSFWINHSPFLFPQHTLKPGQLCDSSLFVTCNLSIRRQAILDAGNFDPAFRVAEDTELGARVAQLGHRVRFEPSAVATHEHSCFTTDDLLRRAANYGAATFHLLRKHPQLLGDGSGPFGHLRAADLRHIENIRQERSSAANSGLQALYALDDFDVTPLWTPDSHGIRPVNAIIEKVAAIVPIVYWHALFEHFLRAASAVEMDRALAESRLPSLVAP